MVHLHQLVPHCCCHYDDMAPQNGKGSSLILAIIMWVLFCHRHHVGSQASAVISAPGMKTSEQWNLFCSWLQLGMHRLWIHRCLSPPITTPNMRAS